MSMFYVNSLIINNKFFVSKVLNIALAIAVLLSVSFVLLSFTSSNELERAEAKRIHAVQLGIELKESSDDLTSMARSYVVTGEKKFKQYFEYISAIRNGELAMPLNYGQGYWDLAIVSGHQPEKKHINTQSLRERIEALGLKEKENELMARAEDNSNELINMEAEAFRLFDLGDRPSAVDMLYSQKYFTEKSRIMGPIKDFIDTVNQRMDDELAGIRKKYNAQVYIAYASLIALLVITFLRMYSDYLIKKEQINTLELNVNTKEDEINSKNMELSNAYETLEMSQARLLELEKIKLMGELIPGVAHEINTPVGVAVTLSTTQIDILNEFRYNFEENKLTRLQFTSMVDDLSSCSNAILKSMRKINKLISQFKSLSMNNQIDNLERVSINALVDDVFMLIKNEEVSGKVNLHNETSEGYYIETYPYLLSLVIFNVVLNAEKHAFKGSESGDINVKVEAGENTITIFVEDNGSGMEQDVAERVFSPFFSTVKNEGATGLGLCIAQNIVTHKLCGKIHCRSALGKGSTFDIELPYLLPSNES